MDNLSTPATAALPPVPDDPTRDKRAAELEVEADRIHADEMAAVERAKEAIQGRGLGGMAATLGYMHLTDDAALRLKCLELAGRGPGLPIDALLKDAKRIERFIKTGEVEEAKRS